MASENSGSKGVIRIRLDEMDAIARGQPETLEHGFGNGSASGVADGTNGGLLGHEVLLREELLQM